MLRQGVGCRGVARFGSKHDVQLGRAVKTLGSGCDCGSSTSISLCRAMHPPVLGLSFGELGSSWLEAFACGMQVSSLGLSFLLFVHANIK